MQSLTGVIALFAAFAVLSAARIALNRPSRAASQDAFWPTCAALLSTALVGFGAVRLFAGAWGDLASLPVLAAWLAGLALACAALWTGMRVLWSWPLGGPAADETASRPAEPRRGRPDVAGRPGDAREGRGRRAA